MPFSKVMVVSKTSSVSGVCVMYSWAPQLWMLMSRCSSTAKPIGETSVGPWKPDLIWYGSACAITFFKRGDDAEVRGRAADVVDELLVDQVLDVVDRVEHLADGQRGRRLLAHVPRVLLV